MPRRTNLPTVTADKESLIGLLNILLKRQQDVWDLSFKKFKDIEKTLKADGNTFAIVAEGASKILAIADSSSDKMIKVAGLLKELALAADKGPAMGEVSDSERQALLDEIDKLEGNDEQNKIDAATDEYEVQ